MEDMRDVLLGLFTETAILEHLMRSRGEGSLSDGLTPGYFGVLNYFVINHPDPDRVSSIAWCFQEEEDYTLSKVTALAELGLVKAEPVDGSNSDPLVSLTQAGREAHAESLNRMAPDIESAVSEISEDDLRTTFRTLREIRLTLDNLPDR